MSEGESPIYDLLAEASAGTAGPANAVGLANAVGPSNAAGPANAAGPSNAAGPIMSKRTISKADRRNEFERLHKTQTDLLNVWENILKLKMLKYKALGLIE